MKCYSCDKILSTKESVRRFKDSGTFVDLCNKCLSTIDDSIETVDSTNIEEEEDEQD